MENWETYAVATAVTALAVRFDIEQGRICNSLTYPAILTGLTINAIYSPEHISDFIAAVIIPVFIFYPLFKIKAIGGGDIKLFSMIGAFTGVRFAAATIAASFVAGGLISIAVMIKRRIFVQRLKAFMTYASACITGRGLSYYNEAGYRPAAASRLKEARFSFSVAILAGLLINIFIMNV